MVERGLLTEAFEENRAHLWAVAYRMLGSSAEADDAVQEAWLKLSRSDSAGVDNPGGWLTTVVARVCLDMLRSRKSRREEPLGTELPGPVVGTDPEDEAVLADSVGLAMLVVLGMLAPAERLAFVLHDMFAVPFDEIAAILDRSPDAARKLASRARRRVQGLGAEDTAALTGADLARQREVVDAFLAASRAGDFDALVAVLDPDVVLHADRTAVPAGAPTELRGAEVVARGALAYSGRAPFSRPALVNGAVGLVLAPRGRLQLALGFTIAHGKIVAVDVIADPGRLAQLDVAVLDR